MLSLKIEWVVWFLRLGGLVMVGLVVANFVAAGRLGYAQSMSGAAKVVRQIFYVHCGYIVMLICGLAVLCLGWPELLLEERMGRLVCGFFAVFWWSRVMVQLIYYDKELRAKERFWDVFFLGVFGYLGFIFTIGFLVQ